MDEVCRRSCVRGGGGMAGSSSDMVGLRGRRKLRAEAVSGLPDFGAVVWQ